MSNELIHYGVPGMKWGVRHDKPSNGYTKTKNKYKTSKTKYKTSKTKYNTAKKERKNDISATTNGRALQATNDDVVSAINKLRKDIANVQGNTYKETTKSLNKSASDIIEKAKSGYDFMQQQAIQQQMNTNFNDWVMKESTRASINAANQAASLSMTGGMNPFMFGMM